MTDQYANYGALCRKERENEDFAIFLREGASRLAVMAVHGGGIEPGTIDIADALAGCEHSFYAFKGLKKTGNRALHIGSSRFDEARGLKVAQEAEVVVTVHGSGLRTEMVHIGGRNERLKQKIVAALNAAGFHAEPSDIPGLRGISPDNICNRCQSGEGVQLEISRGLREKLFDHLDHRSLRMKTRGFYTFVQAVKAVLSGC